MAAGDHEPSLAIKADSNFRHFGPPAPPFDHAASDDQRMFLTGVANRKSCGELDRPTAHGIESRPLCSKHDRIWIRGQEAGIGDIHGQLIEIDLPLHHEGFSQEIVAQVRGVRVIGDRAEDPRQHLARLVVLRIGDDEHSNQLCSPAPLPLLEGSLGGLANLSPTPNQLERALGSRGGRDANEVHGVSVPPTAGLRVHALRNP